jgi:chromosome segregation ATPase
MSDTEMKEIRRQYRKVLDELQDRIEETEAELERLEESGDADHHPVKHQQAVDKIAEIREQISELEEAMEGETTS